MVRRASPTRAVEALVAPALLLSLGLLLAPALQAPARAHSGKPHASPSPKVTKPAAEEEEHAGKDGTILRVSGPKRAGLGATVRLVARLTDDEGDPIAGAEISYMSPAVWGEEISGEMLLGTALTDAKGVAVLEIVARRAGDLEIHAAFAGSEMFEAVEFEMPLMVTGDRQLYRTRVGIKIPGAGWWVVALVVGIIWALYLVVARRAKAISRAAPIEVAASPGPAPHRVGRRELLRAVSLPVAIQGVIAAAGAGLITLISRSPRTHAHAAAGLSSRYHRTPVSLVGARIPMREMPEVLKREVSFSREVMPILMARAGPHVMVSENQPPPSGVRLDGYKHIIGNEGLVVPGKPEESHLVSALLDPAMQMPPGLPPLPEAEIQVIVSWVAQGAKDN